MTDGMKTLLTGATVVTMNPGREILENADLVLEDDRIGTIGPAGSARGENVDHVIDCAGKVILPGLVSAHSHLTGIFQRGLWDERTFQSWSSRSSATEQLLDLSAQEIYTLHAAACLEFLRHGVTTVLNMFTPRPKLSLENIQSACRAFIDTGIRGILALSLQDQSPDSDAIAAKPGARDALLSLCGEAGRWIEALYPRVSFMLAPSAPQRCSDRLLTSSRELAQELRVGIHTHLAETKRHAEVALRLYGEPMVNHLERIGFLGSRLSVAHAIWLGDDELDLLKARDVKVVHNPAANMKLGSGVAAVKKMVRKGLSVGLGADSVNAGTVYSIFEQMKLAALLPRSVWEPESWLLSQEVLEMGTLGGARAVFLDGMIGSIDKGKKADLVVLKPSTLLLPRNDLVNQLVLSENGESVESVYVDGKSVFREGAFTGIDEGAILLEIASLSPRIARARAEILRQ